MKESLILSFDLFTCSHQILFLVTYFVVLDQAAGKSCALFHHLLIGEQIKLPVLRFLACKRK